MKKLMVQALLIFVLSASALASSTAVARPDGTFVISETSSSNIGPGSFTSANAGVGSGHNGYARPIDTSRKLSHGRLGMLGASGDIALPVPEPGTLSLLGMGLLAMATAVRRKLSLEKVDRS